MSILYASLAALPCVAAGADGAAVALPASERLSAGRYHNLALANDGQVYWWGTDRSRAFQRGGALRSGPRLVPGLRDITGVAAGWEHSVAVDRAGKVYEWGFSPYQRFLVLHTQPLLGSCEAARLFSGGHGKDPCASEEVARSERIWTARPITIPSLPPVRAVRALDGHSIAITRDGDVYCWSAYALPQKIPGLARIVDVQLGQFHGVALRADGAVLTWGGGNGALGRPRARDTNNKICQQFNVEPVFSGALGISAIAQGSFAFRADGTIWGWGDNDSGQIGFRTDPERSEAQVKLPRQITTLPGTVRLVAGGGSLLARTADGRLYTWGSNYQNAFGLDTTQRDSLQPVALPALAPGTEIFMSNAHAHTLSADGDVCGWGANDDGQARPDSKRGDVPRPMALLNADGAGAFNLAGVRADPAPTRLCGDAQWRERLALTEAADQQQRQRAERERELLARLKLPGQVSSDSTALIEAARQGDPRTLQALLQAGVALEARDGKGDTALLQALRRSKDDQIAQLLWDGGADIKAVDGLGASALMLAARYRSPALVRRLAGAGLALDARDASGGTALMAAAAGNRRDTMQVLLALGADPQLRNLGGKSASDLLPAAPGADAGPGQAAPAKPTGVAQP